MSYLRSFFATLASAVPLTGTAAFVAAAGLTDATQIQAIYSLVDELQAAGLWEKMTALYPFVGGTARSHQFNLKDPRDADEAFRLTFPNGSAHSAGGVFTFGGVDTHLSPIVSMAQNDSHLSFYSRTDQTGGLEMGSQTSSGGLATFLSYSFSGNGTYQSLNNYDSNVAAPQFLPTTGHLILSRTSAASLTATRGSTAHVLNFPSAGLPTPTMFIGARHIELRGDYAGGKQCAFASIGRGLTSSETQAFQTIVQSYQIRLGRAI